MGFIIRPLLSLGIWYADGLGGTARRMRSWAQVHRGVAVRTGAWRAGDGELLKASRMGGPVARGTSVGARGICRRVLLEVGVPDRGVASVDLLFEHGQESWEVREDERPLLGGHLVLLGPELVQQLATHRLEHRPEQRPPEDHGGLRVRQAVAERRHVAEAQPPGVVDLVSGGVLVGGVLPLLLPGRRGFQLPVVEAVKKHLGQVVHGLPLLLRQVPKLVHHEVGDRLCDAWLLEGRVSKWSFYGGACHQEDALAQQLEQIEVDLFGVCILLTMDAHEHVLDVHHNPE
uniref:Putative secreted protein n=1 Tax=Ixodes ricinus TaxID=34613 RepID=A0A6B0V7V5_IXORI